MNQFIEFCLAFIQDRISLCFWYWNLLVLFCVLLFFLNLFLKVIIYSFIFISGCPGSLLLHMGFL